jgi:hypothetical protein
MSLVTIPGWYNQEIEDLSVEKSMENKSKHGWKWAYRKLRGLHCSRVTAVLGATLYLVRGDTGSLMSQDKWQKIRLKR